MKINNLKELEEYGELKYMDRVYFTVGEETVEYEVDGDFLRNTDKKEINSKIFNL